MSKTGEVCVSCDVKNCLYHGQNENVCTASEIDVQNKTARSKSETFCGTFYPRTGM